MNPNNNGNDKYYLKIINYILLVIKGGGVKQLDASLGAKGKIENRKIVIERVVMDKDS
jgi:hypothetical protein